MSLKITKTAEDLKNETTAQGTEEVKKAKPGPKPLSEYSPFKPSTEQMKLKAQFFSMMRNQNLSPDDITADKVNDVTGNRFTYNWFRNSEFVTWFKDAEENHAKVNYLLSLHLSNLEEILLNRDGIYQPKDLLAAGKQITDLDVLFRKEGKEDPSLSVDAVKELAAKMFEAKKLKKPEPEPRKVELPV
jgi:hypothetical protein